MMLARCAMIFLVVCLAQFASAGDPPFPESMVTIRAQPAVFVIRATADVELTTPRSVSVNLDALKADLSPAPDAGGHRAAEADRYWALIARNPHKYLVASQEPKIWTLPGASAWWGSAFAVSREGILLTNAHVVSGHTEKPLAPESWELIDEPLGNALAEIERVLGRPTLTADGVQKLGAALYSWYAAHAQFEAKFKSARIVLSHSVDPKKQLAVLRGHGIADAFRLKPEEVTAPVTVLAIGESLPGKDVAVLKVTFDPEEQSRLVKLSQQRKMPALDAMLAQIQNERLVCLPLGDSADVLPQARVQALGIPGIAFNSGLMDAGARFKVSARGGQISQTKRMSGSGGWDAFEMTTAIEHGDSGGPVLDVQANVIAINVGTAQDKPGTLRLAVPVNLAKELLAKAGVVPDVGELAKHWEQGLRLFADGKYAAAEQQFLAAEALQQGGSVLTGREVSWYLKHMRGRCLQKLRKIPEGN